MKAEAESENKFFMVIKAAMNVPGVRINRDAFLEKELSNHFTSNKVKIAIEKNPACAGITVKDINSIAKSCINYETSKVSAISVVAGIPGGFAMMGTIPADIVQYFAHIIRILQKLVYLYGWQSMVNEDGEFDDETKNQLILFMGVMFGVNAANVAVSKLAQSAAIKAEKSIARKPLTKGIIYPIVKKIAQILGKDMTKEIFAKGVSKVIPVLGGALSGGLTYMTFKPSAIRLKKYLASLPTADTNFYKQTHDDIIVYDLGDI